MSHSCPYCGADTTYQMLSGGREWFCPGCEANGNYPDEGEGLPRATLLRTEAGRVALSAQMDQELARRAEHRAGSPAEAWNDGEYYPNDEDDGITERPTE